jgi:hypothetical protein
MKDEELQISSCAGGGRWVKISEKKGFKAAGIDGRY